MVQARTNIGLFSKQYSFASEAILLCGRRYIDTRVEHRKDRRRRLYSRDFVRQHAAPITFPSDGSSYIILSPIELSIRRKIEAVGKPLKDWDVKIYRGVLTGCNEAFIITTEKRDELLAQCQTEEERQRTAELIRPILRGRDIKRYSYDWAGLWVIATFPSRHYDIEDYPTVRDYLLSFGKERLEQTGKTYTIDGVTFKSRKKTANKWFEMQDSIAYWKDFDRPILVWLELSDSPKFALSNGLVPLNTVFFLSGKSVENLLALLNSKLVTWYFRECLGTSSGVGTNRWLKYTIENLPLVEESTGALSSLIVQNEEMGTISPAQDTQIESLISSLYGLSSEEQAHIDSYITFK